MSGHDHSYKLLFSHPQMVRDLLEGFIPGDWLLQFDYDSLEGKRQLRQRRSARPYRRHRLASALG